MTKTRTLVAGAVAVFALSLGGGIAAAQSDPPTPPTDAPHGMHDMGDMDAMHGQMRTQMPDEMQAQCDTARTQTGTMMNGGMMSR